MTECLPIMSVDFMEIYSDYLFGSMDPEKVETFLFENFFQDIDQWMEMYWEDKYELEWTNSPVCVHGMIA